MDIRKKYEASLQQFQKTGDKNRFLKSLLKISTLAANSYEHDIFDGMSEYFVTLGDMNTVSDIEDEITRLKNDIKLNQFMIDFFNDIILLIKNK